MIGLFDVNALIALFDPEHVHHQAAHAWFADHRKSGWATCPLTENGLIRVLSHPQYPGRGTTVADAVERLQRFRKSGDHVFWPDSVSLCDTDRLRFQHVQGHRQITDLYLLALAVHKRGRLVTFDRRIRPDAVVGGSKRHLQRLGEPLEPKQPPPEG